MPLTGDSEDLELHGLQQTQQARLEALGARGARVNLLPLLVDTLVQFILPPEARLKFDLFYWRRVQAALDEVEEREAVAAEEKATAERQAILLQGVR